MCFFFVIRQFFSKVNKNVLSIVHNVFKEKSWSPTEKKRFKIFYRNNVNFLIFGILITFEKLFQENIANYVYCQIVPHNLYENPSLVNNIPQWVGIISKGTMRVNWNITVSNGWNATTEKAVGCLYRWCVLWIFVYINGVWRNLWIQYVE